MKWLPVHPLHCDQSHPQHQKKVALWGEPEQAVAQRGEEQQNGWLLLLHLCNQGRRSMCTWHVYTLICRSLISVPRFLSSSIVLPHLVMRCGNTRLLLQLHDQHALLYLLSCTYSVCVLFALLFQQHGALSCTFGYIYVCGVLRGSL